MDTWSLSVGIKYYPDTDFGDLHGPELDAKEFHDWVKSPAGGGVSDPSRARLILSSDYGDRPATSYDANPTTEKVNQFFVELNKIVSQKRRNGDKETIGDRLYLYFSGHGFMPPANKDEVAVLMANAERYSPNHILATAWAEMFYQSGYFREILLFMDCCRNELKNAPRNVPFMSPPNDPEAGTKGRRFYAYATKWGRFARERTLPPNGDSRGVFTAALLAGLKGGAADPVTQQVRATDLRSFLYQNMKQFLAEEDRASEDIAKEPDVYPSMGEEENFLIATAANIPYPVRFDVPPGLAGRKFTVYRGRKIAAATDALTVPSWQHDLPRGLYDAELEGSSAEISFEVKHPGFELGIDPKRGVNVVSL